MKRFLSIILCGVMVLFSGCAKQLDEKEEAVKESSKKNDFKDVEIVDYTSAYLDADMDSIWYLAELKNPNESYEVTSIKVIFTLFDEDDNEIESREDYICNIMPNESVHWVTREYSDDGKIDHFKFRVEDAEYEECEKNADSYVKNVSLADFEEKESSIFAVLKNDSDMEFDSVHVILVFYNENDEMVYADQMLAEDVAPHSEKPVEFMLRDGIPAFDHYETYIHGTLN